MPLTCSLCHKTIASRYFEKQEEIYCVPCFEKKFQKICISCGNKIPIENKYYVYENNTVFCLQCNATPPCFTCLLPVGTGPVNLKDGRKICKFCKSKVVMTDEMLSKILGAVQRCMTSLLHMLLSNTISVKMVDLKQMQAISPGKNTLGFFRVRGSKKIIHVLSGLLPGTVVAVLAHELTHAWQYENNIKTGISDKDKEGFAEWVAYKVLSELKYPAPRDAIKKNYYGKYREGFKGYLQLEKRKGIQGVVQSILNK